MVVPTIVLESSLWKEGFKNIAGLDEAGRGPLAGPVSAGAVVIHSESQMVQVVRDSKKMTSKKRDIAFDEIISKSSAYGMGIVDAEYINKHGIQQAVHQAMLIAVSQAEERLGEKVNYLLIDGANCRSISGYPQQKMNSGDLNHYSIAAASVLAKVARDRLMVGFAKEFPGYGFEKHMGYGTKFHLEALKSLGPCAIHRTGYKPISLLLND